jgi:hypothetical protein
MGGVFVTVSTGRLGPLRIHILRHSGGATVSRLARSDDIRTTSITSFGGGHFTFYE